MPYSRELRDTFFGDISNKLKRYATRIDPSNNDTSDSIVICVERLQLGSYVV